MARLIKRRFGLGLLFVLVGCGDPMEMPDAGPEPSDSGAVLDAGAACRTDAQCDDGLFCTGVERCVEGVCEAGDGMVCDDDIACTEDRCSEDARECTHEPPDADGDGVGDAACLGATGLPLGRDCDDADADRYPDNPEVCDAEGHDEDCDLETFGYRDVDMDGYPDARCCNTQDDGSALCGTDCDDAVGGTNPASPEVCEGADNDCDGEVDEGVLETFYVDADGDGRGDPTTASAEACFAPAGYADRAGDCDDTNSVVYEGAPEVCDAAALDENCDGVANPDSLCSCSGSETRGCLAAGACAAGVERCSDGLFGACSISPVAEVCNGIDDDCNGVVDDGLLVACFDDPDDDGYAMTGATMSDICPVGGRAAVGGCPIGFTNRAPLVPNLDCSEGVASTYPGAPETCNAVDDDCDAVADEGLPLRVRYIDADGDGAEGTPVERCEGDPDSVPTSRDCNESDVSVYVGAPEICDRVDNNCSLGGGASGGVDVFEDEDGDGYAPLDTTLCAGGPLPRTDCDDTRPSDNPGATEVCSGFDSDCDGTVDEDPEAFDSCVAPDASAGCAMDGACAVFACDTGFADCNRDYADGCEVDLRSDGANCGGCGFTCGAGAPCNAGLCDVIEALSAGLDHSCARFRSGALSCTGKNAGGALGDGTTAARRTTYTAARGVTDAVHVDAGPGHTCAAQAGGGAQCWGENQDGQLGSGARSLNERTPQEVVGLTGDALQIAAGALHTCARLATGEVQCWGRDNVGQLGTGAVVHDDCRRASETEPRNCALSAVLVPGLSGVVDIAAYGGTNCAVRADGAVMCWGQNNVGQLGDGGTTTSEVVVAVPGVTDARRVAVGGRTVCAILNDNTVTCWGDTALLGAGGGSGLSGPTAVIGLTDATAIDASERAACVLRSPEGQVACWGSNLDDAIGTAGASGATVTQPTDLAGLAGATSLAMGDRHGCALLGQRIECWGTNTDGQFGNGTTASAAAPVEVPGLLLAAEVDLWGAHACARSTSGTLACWGSNSRGQLGQASVGGSSLTAVQVPGFQAVSYTGDEDSSCAVDPDGDVWCWGRFFDTAGGSLIDQGSPRPLLEAGGITPFGGVVRAQSARRNTCFLRADGTLWCMGTNGGGVLGNGSTTSSVGVPVQVEGLTDVHAFDVADTHACAVERDGHAYCWGSNGLNALGRGGSSGGIYNSPQRVVHYDDIVDIRTASRTTCVLRATGELACWGGLLAGSTASPVVVSGLPLGATYAFDATSGSICALTDVTTPIPNRPVHCWNSDNGFGQMGNGTQTPVPSPSQVLTFSDFETVATGSVATCGVRDGRRSVACWGNGTPLGDGSGTLSTTPVTVVGFP